MFYKKIDWKKIIRLVNKQCVKLFEMLLKHTKIGEMQHYNDTVIIYNINKNCVINAKKYSKLVLNNICFFKIFYL